MPEEKSGKESPIECPICGHESPPDSKRCENCYHELQPSPPKVKRRREKAKTRQEPDTDEKEEGPGELTTLPGVGDKEAERLQVAGYLTVKDIQEAKLRDLAGVKGIGKKLAAKLIREAVDQSEPEDRPLANWLLGEEDDLSEWLSGEAKGQQAAAAVSSRPQAGDSLSKWLAGQENDLSSWLEEPRAIEPPSEEMGPHELLAREAELIQLRETLREKLEQFESGDFDPAAVIEDLAKTRAELGSERVGRQHLEEELENVKRGSLAVIKFIKNQQDMTADASTLADKLAMEMAQRENLELKIMQLEEVISALREKAEGVASEMPPEAQELKRQETDLAERRAELEALQKQLLAKEEALSTGLFAEGVALAEGAGVANTEAVAKREQELFSQIQELEAKLNRAEIDLKHKDEVMSLSSGKGSKVDKQVMEKLESAQGLERELAVREQEVQRLREDLRIREEDLKKLKEPLAYKEQEMIRREEDLMYREKLLQEELKKASQLKAELTSAEEIPLKKRLEELQSQVTIREEEIRNKEKWLSAKEEELRLREQGVITEEIEKREAERMMEIKVEKIKTGTSRLDDLLLGGIPFGSNVMIYGPPFTGKEVLVNAFIAEGLKKGVPAMWILTEKAPREIREEMLFVLSGYEEYEKLGLVKYIDAYSRSMGDETEDPYTEYIESPTDYESIQKAVEMAAKDFKTGHAYYRMAFRSLSTLIAYLDSGTVFRFLSPVAGRRKRDKAVSMYTVEKGVHGEQEIQMLGSLMDGMIEFKVENLNTFLSIRGICDAQSRAFIRYSASKTGVSVGSFSLDHIR